MNDIHRARSLFARAVESALPSGIFRNLISLQDRVLLVDGHPFELERFRKIYVLGFGKASAAMAVELGKILESAIHSGLVITKYGHAEESDRICIREAGHPFPDQAGLEYTSELIEIARNANRDDLVICLVSGGGSALLEALPGNISIDDLRRLTGLLLAAGASIREINTVRKHVSSVKGGRLAEAISPATCVSLILSDVIGDPVDFIASGPTAPDTSTFDDALAVLGRYKLLDSLPESILDHLNRGADGQEPETLKPDHPCFDRVLNIVVGSNAVSLHAAASQARNMGLNTSILTSRLEGEAREAARVLLAMAREILHHDTPVRKPACLLAGGETTVTITGNGKGGRNQELAAAVLAHMVPEDNGITILSCGTDGTDGPTDAAGGVACWNLADIARKKGLNPRHALEENDSFAFLEACGGLVKTGPTGTNVMDIIVVIVNTLPHP